MRHLRFLGPAALLPLVAACEQVVGITDLSVRPQASTGWTGGDGDPPPVDLAPPDGPADSSDAAPVEAGEADAAIEPEVDASSEDAGENICTKLRRCCMSLGGPNGASCLNGANTGITSTCQQLYDSLCH